MIFDYKNLSDNDISLLELEREEADHHCDLSEECLNSEQALAAAHKRLSAAQQSFRDWENRPLSQRKAKLMFQKMREDLSKA